MRLKTTSMRQLLKRAETQAEVFEDPETAKLKKLFSEHLRSLAEKYEAAIKDDEARSRLAKIIEDFSRSECVDMGVETMLENFAVSLEMLEALERLPLEQNLKDCLDYVREMGSVNAIEDFRNIKELGSWILDVFGPLQSHGNNLASKLLSGKVDLYLRQLYEAFEMLVSLVEEQHELNAPIYNHKKYVCDRLCLCFQMILEVLDAPNPSLSEENAEVENHFVNRMDLALDLISEMQKQAQDQERCESLELWSLIEHAMSHAMSIAQVCQPYNFKAITGVCRSIALEFEKVKSQLETEPPDPTMSALFLTTLNDALYRLEHRINVSMLTLVMELFSEPFGPLKKLVKSCGNALHLEARASSDLADGVEEFDQLADKAMQIGFFALACCRDNNRSSGVRSCLASFESLETELVAAIISFYLHPNNEIRASVKLLTAQWQKEMNAFHHSVNLIIDSAAFCQVVMDDLQERIKIMSDRLDSRERLKESQVQGVVQRALAVSRQVSATIDDIGRGNIDRMTIMTVRELKAAIYEADAAAKKLLNDNAPEPQQLRVIKRCELILQVVKKLHPALVVIMNNSVAMKSVFRHSDGSFSIASNPVTYVRTPYTVKSCKSALSIEPANSVAKPHPDASCLIPYIKKGQEMRTERSVMYKTPKKSANPVEAESKLRNLSNVRQHLFSRESFLGNAEVDFTAESINLTNILERIMNLSEAQNTSKEERKDRDD